MRRKLTPASTLDNIKKEAKRWLKALRADDPDARARLLRLLPDEHRDPGLRGVQHALAREYGFDGWAALKAALAEGVPGDPRGRLVESFLRNASLDWRVGGSLRISEGRTADRILQRHPEIARENIYTAVVSGDLEEVERILREEPQAASEPGGPRNWPPLLYLCSARLLHPPASANAVAIARALLDHGADPNAYYLGGNEQIHYTSLTCAAGEGEEDAPPHPRREELWKLLLERGAEPYDMQTLYNTHFRGDVLWFLELMHEWAIKRGRAADWADPDWNMLGMGGYGQGARYLLNIAVQKNDVTLAEWLIAHGASPNPGPSSHPKAPRRSLVEEALLLGHSEIAELLIRHGAPRVTPVLEGVEAFAATCSQLDTARAKALLAMHPEYLHDPRTMFQAARRNRADVVAFLLELGTSIELEDEHGTRPLHEAAYGDAPEVVKLLLARGADPDPREKVHGNTPLGHAVYGKRQRIIELLVPVSRDVWELTWIGALARLREVLSAEPSLALVQSSDGHTPLMWLPDDDMAALEIARLFLANGADPSARNQAGETAADRARARGLDEVADLLSATRASSRRGPYEQLARDLVAGFSRGDADTLSRLSEYFGHPVTHEEVREHVRDRHGDGDFALPDAERLVARLYGFGSWTVMMQSLTRPPGDPGSPRGGMSPSPPFYKIDRKRNTLEPRPPLSDRDWDTLFAIMKEQGITGLDAGGHMTDAVLARVSQLEFVTTLNLGGGQRVSDDGLLHLRHMPQLRELDLSGWHSPITDRGLEVLRHLAELRRFQMCWARRISDAGVANLTFCDHLEQVNLLGSTTGDGAINALTGKRHLRKFSTGQLVTDAGLPLLHRFPVFKTWQGGTPEYDLMSFDPEPNHLLLDGPFTDAGLAGIAGLDGLFGLNLFWHVPAMTPAGMAPLKDLPNLGFLGCHGQLCDDQAMPHIAAIPRLRMLMGQGTIASDEGFTALSRSQSIEYIWGRECPNLKSRGFAALASMPALRGLAVSCKNVDDAALASLPMFPALRELMPIDVSDDGFRHVGGCIGLEGLWCMYCRDTGDVATSHLATLTRLKSYYAGKTRITDRSLEMLSGMASIEKLELWECAGITNAGVGLLAGLPRLREISVGGCPKVSRDGMDAFPTSVRADYY